MNIEADVSRVARAFGVHALLLQAVVAAEGDIVRAVQWSIPSVWTRAEALEITARSAVHAMCDWISSGGAARRHEFIASWALRWAPIGAANDPTNLNANWPRNVEKLWTPTGVDV